MSVDTPIKQEDTLKAYKHYSAEHYSQWRFLYYRFILWAFIIPYMRSKFQTRVFGQANIPKNRPFIVASNHISMLDPPLLAWSINYPIAFMAKTELFNKPWKRIFYRSVGCFAVERENPDSASLRTALNVLRSNANWALGLFPEGTRSPDGQLLPLKKGVGALAAKTNTVVLPVGIVRTGAKTFDIHIGELITDVSNSNAVQEKLYTALSTLIQQK